MSSLLFLSIYIILYMGELPAIPKILIRRERGRLSRRDDEAERWYEDCLEAIPSREVMRDDGRGGRKDERSAVTLLRGRSCAPAVASSSSVLCLYILIILLIEKNISGSGVRNSCGSCGYSGSLPCSVLLFQLFPLRSIIGHSPPRSFTT